jgi:hypothetical protein
MLLATAFGSTTSLTASIPADKLLDGAVASVTVSSPAPGGGTSQGVSFSVNNPVPTVASVSPSGVLAGSAGAMLDVSGTGFGFHRNRLPRREEPHYAARVPPASFLSHAVGYSRQSKVFEECEVPLRQSAGEGRGEDGAKDLGQRR